MVHMEKRLDIGARRIKSIAIAALFSRLVSPALI
jgi:hypothetical protein